MPCIGFAEKSTLLVPPTSELPQVTTLPSDFMAVKAPLVELN